MATIASTKRTKKFKALIAAGLEESAALTFLGVEAPAPQPEVDPAVAALIAAGFSEAEALAALGMDTTSPAAPAAPAAPEPPKQLTSKDHADALVDEQGFTFTKGRVYLTPDAIEAAVRVRKTSAPEIVASSGNGRTAAVVLYVEATGDVAVQNLVRA